MKKKEDKQQSIDLIVLQYAAETGKRCIPRNDKTTLEIITESIKRQKLDKS